MVGLLVASGAHWELVQGGELAVDVPFLRGQHAFKLVCKWVGVRRGWCEAGGGSWKKHQVLRRMTFLLNSVPNTSPTMLLTPTHTNAQPHSSSSQPLCKTHCCGS